MKAGPFDILDDNFKILPSDYSQWRSRILYTFVHANLIGLLPGPFLKDSNDSKFHNPWSFKLHQTTQLKMLCMVFWSLGGLEPWKLAMFQWPDLLWAIRLLMIQARSPRRFVNCSIVWLGLWNSEIYHTRSTSSTYTKLHRLREVSRTIVPINNSIRFWGTSDDDIQHMTLAS